MELTDCCSRFSRYVYLVVLCASETLAALLNNKPRNISSFNRFRLDVPSEQHTCTRAYANRKCTQHRQISDYLSSSKFIFKTRTRTIFGYTDIHSNWLDQIRHVFYLYYFVSNVSHRDDALTLHTHSISCCSCLFSFAANKPYIIQVQVTVINKCFVSEESEEKNVFKVLALARCTFSRCFGQFVDTTRNEFRPFRHLRKNRIAARWARGPSTTTVGSRKVPGLVNKRHIRVEAYGNGRLSNNQLLLGLCCDVLKYAPNIKAWK